MRPGPNRVGHNCIFVMPEFIHEIGDAAHHHSMTRTCNFDKEGTPIPGTGPSDRRYWIHELLDLWIFYPVKHTLSDALGDGGLYDILSNILGFFWGLNCGFPARDVARYTAWVFKGCKPRAVYKRREGKWMQTYP